MIFFVCDVIESSFYVNFSFARFEDDIDFKVGVRLDIFFYRFYLDYIIVE